MADKTVTLKTTGMHCRSCAALIQMSVGEIDGVSQVHVDHEAATTEVVYDPETVSVDSIAAEIVKLGYGAEL